MSKTMRRRARARTTEAGRGSLRIAAAKGIAMSDQGRADVATNKARAAHSESAQVYRSGINSGPTPEEILSLPTCGPSFCSAADPLTDAVCQLRRGHADAHWGHGPIRRWSADSPSTPLPTISETDAASDATASDLKDGSSGLRAITEQFRKQLTDLGIEIFYEDVPQPDGSIDHIGAHWTVTPHVGCGAQAATLDAAVIQLLEGLQLVARSHEKQIADQDAQIARLTSELEEAKSLNVNVKLQRHRDHWREYAYGNRDKPQDYLDGNKVDRGETKLEKLEAALTTLRSQVQYLRALYLGAYYAELRIALNAVVEGTALPPVPFDMANREQVTALRDGRQP